MDPLLWMGAVRMRVQTADKNITIIHTTLRKHTIIFFVRYKSIIKIFLTFWEIAFCSGKSRLVWITREIGTDQAVFTSKNSLKQLEDNRSGLFHWRKRYCGLWSHILAKSNSLKFTQSFLLHKTLIHGRESCGLLVDYCNVFISCLDGTHSLQRIHWWANNVQLDFWWRN